MENIYLAILPIPMFLPQFHGAHPHPVEAPPEIAISVSWDLLKQPNEREWEASCQRMSKDHKGSGYSKSQLNLVDRPRLPINLCKSRTYIYWFRKWTSSCNNPVRVGVIDSNFHPRSSKHNDSRLGRQRPSLPSLGKSYCQLPSPKWYIQFNHVNTPRIHDCIPNVLERGSPFWRSIMSLSVIESSLAS